MKIVIIGPNLGHGQQKLGQFHVHRDGCMDVTRSYTIMDRAAASVMDAENRREIVTAVYDPGDFQYDPTDKGEYGPFEADFYWAPCTNALEKGGDV